MATFNILGLTDPTPLDPATNNVWGPLVNSNNDMCAQAIVGILNLDVSTGPTVILTNTPGTVDQARNRRYKFTGALTQNVTVLWPNGVNRFFSALNATTGAFTVTLGADDGTGHAGGTTQTLAQGDSLEFFSNGTGIFFDSNSSSLLATANSWALQQTFQGGAAFTGVSDVTLDPAQATVSEYSVGFRGTPSTFIGGGYTFAPTDSGTKLIFSSASNHNWTIPPQSSVPSTDSTITIIQGGGGGTLFIVPGAGVTLVWSPAGTHGTRTMSPVGIATLYQQSNEDIWYITGTGIT